MALTRDRDAQQRGLQIVEGRGVAHGASVSLLRWQLMSSLSLGAAGLGSKRKTWRSGATGTRSGRTSLPATTSTKSRQTTALRRKLLRSEEHTSELQSLMRISYAVFCLKKKNNTMSRTHTSTQRDTQHHGNITTSIVK